MKLALLILDGFGLPIKYSKYIKKLYENKLSCKLGAAENFVGLPKKVMGNSEIGHLNIGGGREFQHILLKINDTIKKKEFSKINEIQNIKKRLNQNKSNLHIIGMYSESGVHSHLNHLKELIKTFELYNIKLHIITDGRDTDKKSAKKYIDKINNIIKKKKRRHKDLILLKNILYYFP